MNFVDMLPKIQKMASNICEKYRDKFSVDELVNEAWIGSIMNSYTDAPLIMRAAKLDIIDYIRTHVGRNCGKEEEVDKLCKYFRIKKYPKFITNCQSPRFDSCDNLFRESPFLDGVSWEKGYDEIDNKEFINMLLSKISIKRSTAMIHYYLQEKSLIETGTLMGGKKACRVSTSLKQGREECLRVVENMGLDQSGVIGV